MKKSNLKSEIWVTIFHDGWDLITQSNGDNVTFRGNDMYLWRDGTICATYNLSKYKKWCITDKEFQVERGVWYVKYFLDI